MFDISWSEMALIAIVALIFIGPKELPAVLRNVGKWVTAARNMAREFQGHVDDLVKETELDEVRRNIRENTAETLKDLADHIDPDRTIRDDGLHPDKLMAGETKPAAQISSETSSETSSAEGAPAADPVLPLPDAPAPPSDAELAAFAQSISEPVKLGSDYHPPSDAPPADAPVADAAKQAQPAQHDTAQAAAEPAKNAGAVEPGRA